MYFVSHLIWDLRVTRAGGIKGSVIVILWLQVQQLRVHVKHEREVILVIMTMVVTPISLG